MDEALAILRRRARKSLDDDLLQELDGALSVPTLRVPLTRGATQAWLLGANSANDDFEISPRVGAHSPDLDSYLEEDLRPSANGIQTFTHDRVLSIVSEGLAAGFALAAIIAEVSAQRQAGVFSLARAGGIGVYETNNAFIDGRRSAVLLHATRLGRAAEKRWITVGDGRVEEVCEGNERAGWIPFEESYPSGHDAPLAHSQCRCDEEQRIVT
jgi:hypothetical protein